MRCGDSSMGMGEDPAERAVRELLTDRTAVISSVLKGDISYEAGREKLRHIEAEELYEIDVDIMKKYRGQRMGRGRSMDILKTEKTSSLYDTAAFGVEIEWTCDGSEGEYRFKESYHVGAEKGGGWISPDLNEYQIMYCNLHQNGII